ncbi:MAG: YraN family protein [Chloroflexi bacterium]|nr:YraN family protein [Chloroflexota bacterium]
MAGAARSEIGACGEAIAARHLEARGCKILARNWRPPRGSRVRGEIDIVASCEFRLLFVEVRTRRSDTFGEPEESIDPRKYATLVAAAEAYVQFEIPAAVRDDCDWRIDLIAVRLDAHNAVQRLGHIEGLGG